jgi:hypothetical protein
MDGINVLCLGMKRSGSTWQYNAARRILSDLAKRPEPPETVEEADLQDRRSAFAVRFVKVHNIPHDISRRLVENPHDAFLYIHRDIRDVAASWKAFTGTTGAALRTSMQEVVDNHVRMMYWFNGAPHCQMLEQLYANMIESPADELSRLAGFLQGFVPAYMPKVSPLSAEREVRLLAATDIEQVVMRGRTVDNSHNSFDHETHYYGNHISEWKGRVGIWDEVLKGNDRATAIEMWNQANERIALDAV